MKRLAFIVPIMAFVFFFSCKPQQKVASERSSSKKPLPAWARGAQQQPEDPTQLFYNAMREKMAGNTANAIVLFNQVLHADPNNAGAMYNLAQLYLLQNNYADALQQITKASQLEPTNTWYAKVKAETLIRSNKWDEAVVIYQKLIKQNPAEQEYYYSLITAFVYKNKPNEALKVYDKMEQHFGVLPETSIQKEKLYIKLQKIDKAAAELEKLIVAYPKEVSYYGMLAELYQANNLMDKALEVYKKMEAIDPDNAFLQLALADYYRTKGDKEKSFTALKKAFVNREVDVDTKFKILASYYSLMQTYPEMAAQAMELNQIMVETHPNVAAAHAFYGDFLTRDKKFEAARVEFMKAKNLDPKTFDIWKSLMGADLNLKNFVSLSAVADSAIEVFPNQALVYDLSGIAKLQLKQYEKAITVLTDGVKLVVDDNALLTDFYANIGEAYYRQKKNKESDAAFDKAIAIDAKNANTLNNYSYYLSLRGDSLTKAERLSKLSNELEPENSYYQDTYGWILYKLAKYADAKEWLEKAMKSRDGESGVIFEHYGDILYKLGETDKAYEYWLKARQSGGASDLLEKKISNKKLFE